jgi:hypothetical protein
MYLNTDSLRSLRKLYWDQHLWGRGYLGGNVTDEVWKKSIED